MNTKISIGRGSSFVVQAMRWTMALTLAAILLAGAGAQPRAASATDGMWIDEFNGPELDPAWSWLGVEPPQYSFAAVGEGTFLRIAASEDPAGARNMILRGVTEENFSVETKLLFQPDTNFQFAGLVIYQDAENFVQFGQAFCDVEGPCIGEGIYFDKVIGNENVDDNFATGFNTEEPVYLRLEKRGDMVRGFYSQEGITWTRFGIHYLPEGFVVSGVGLTASQDYNTPDWQITADFDYFTLSDGWGFMPDGFHDYSGGDVPDYSCNAGGWAVDPDDRATDLWIEVNVDGEPLETWAGEYRSDLNELGWCLDGSCGYNLDLWPLISHYEDHMVTVYAQDIPSGDWVRLDNSPKPLACRTYDIYIHDTLTGESRLLAALDGSGEYNPGWSPDGRYIVHDLVSDTGLDIYVTEVATGITTPLAGAEGGNDAVWSPDGRLIAFDRRWVDDPSIYYLPATGGMPRLVRENAVSAGWAPYGLRLVFQDNISGEIKTVNQLGLSETVVADYGENPAWSPDGKWIAFDRGGEIWKVRVTMGGIPLGDPVQVTGEAVGKGQPTWSADSQQIVFHGGFESDYDLWTVGVAGGQFDFLLGADGFGDYDPSYSRDGRYIAYSSYALPSAPRQWVAMFTADIPVETWGLGEHTYQLINRWAAPEPGEFFGPVGSFTVSAELGLYDGYVILRGARELAGYETDYGLDCFEVNEILEGQATRFVTGWLDDQWMTYPQAVEHFNSMAYTAEWDVGTAGEGSMTLGRQQILPYRPENWWPYVCAFTR